VDQSVNADSFHNLQSSKSAFPFVVE